MAIFVEYLARPVPVWVRARLVAEQSGAKGRTELGEMLGSLGLSDHEKRAGQSGHAYAFVRPTDIVRAMHAGAVPVERAQVEALLRLGRIPLETKDRDAVRPHEHMRASPN